MPAPRLVLASASPRRIELLRQIGLDPTVDPAALVESVPSGADASTGARLLAVEKANAVAPRHTEDVVVLAADTLVSVAGDILGKPADDDEAVAMLTRLSGATHEVHTGVWVGRSAGGGDSTVATTRVTMRELSPAEIHSYVATREAVDAAGAYAIQGRAAAFVERIDGEYSNVVGLPLGLVTRMLAGAGIEVHERWGVR